MTPAHEATEVMHIDQEDGEGFLENAAIAIQRTDEAGIVRFANRAELALRGASADEVVGRHVREAHVDPHVVDDILACLARGETITDRDVRLRTKDGIKCIQVTANAVLRDGAVVATHWFSRDVTAARQAQDDRDAVVRASELLSAELQLDKLVQTFTELATELCHAEYGAFFYNVTNYAGESYMLYTLAGAPRDAFARFQMPRVTPLFEPTFRGDGVVRVGDVRKDPRYGKMGAMPAGHLPVTSYLAVPVATRSGEVLGGLFFSHSQPDVFTERDERLMTAIAAQAATAIKNARLYEAQREARTAAETAQRHTALLYKISTALSRALSADEAARTVVREALALVGARAGSILLLDSTGTQIERFVFEGDGEPGLQARIAALPLSAEVPVCEAARTGKLVWLVGREAIVERYPALTWLATSGLLTWGAVPIVFEGRTLGAIGLRCNDERVLGEDDETLLIAVGQQCGMAIERARLHDVTQAARADAERASRAKDEFLAMLGHELRNPLSPILTAVQLMRMRGDDKSSREQNIIERQVNHLIHLVDDLLDISRITQGKVQLEKRPTKITQVITKAIEIASPLCEERRHVVAVQIAPGDTWVQADETRLCQVVTNLLTNAAKYTPPDGRIEIRAVRGDGHVEIVVRDNGVGITPELLPKVFDLFVQGERSVDRQQGGLGIGLALVRNLVAMHGGTVRAHSDGPGKGTEVVVRLPTIELAAATTVTAQMPPLSVTARRVLVVDDNEDAGTLLGEMLRSVGHDVLVTTDGVRALQALEKFRPDVGILDIGLPVMDGYELAAALRERLGPSLRLMAVTGYGQEQDRLRAREAGFELHFTKPVALPQIVSAIEVDPD